MIQIKNSLPYKLNKLGYRTCNGYYWFKDYENSRSLQQVITLKYDLKSLEYYAIEILNTGILLPDMMKDVQIAMNRVASDFKALKE